MASTLPLSEIPTLSLLYRLSKLGASASPPVTTPSARYNGVISLIRTDIIKLRVGAIVNAANETLLGGGGVDGAIHRAAGRGLYTECKRLKGCKTGSAKITGAYDLPCDKVIHAVGPIYSREFDPEEKLRSCYRKSLDLASENGCKSIAFSALSTGVYGYPSRQAAYEAIGEVRDWLKEKGEDMGGIERIVFCCFDTKDVKAYEEYLPQYFPPTSEDVPERKESSKEEMEAAAELEKSMPDPPTTEPVVPGEPATKKQKVTETKHEDEKDDEWLLIKKPSMPAPHHYFEHEKGEIFKSRLVRADDMSESQIRTEMRKSELEEETRAMYDGMERGADVPRNMLEKDW